VAVVDTTSPTLLVPADASVYADTSSGIGAQGPAAAAFLASATAADIVDPHPVVTNDAPAFLGVGPHVIMFSARDASGNSVSKSAVLTVLAMPPVGTTPPPAPVPPPQRRLPTNVDQLKAEAGDGRVRLSWKKPADVDHVAVTRSLPDGSAKQVVYDGSAESFTDKGVVNGVEYRYLVVSVASDGVTSAGVVVLARPKRSLLKAPKDGAKLRAAPKLVWLQNAEASYYNVQLFRGDVKILSAWPVRATLLLKKQWTYSGKKYRLSRGSYRWYVWPGFGARPANDYGEMLGFSNFEIIR
jgi:hypothetical protein